MNTTAMPDESQLRALVDAADRAYSQGQPAESARLLDLAHSSAPNNAAVVNACGVHALRTGNAAEGKQYFERAIALNASAPAFYLNLASCLRDLDDSGAEMSALQTALALDPYFYLAIFQKAALHERLGQRLLAAMDYQTALNAMRASGSQVPSTLRPLVEHAQQVVHGNYRELEDFVEARLRDVRDRHGQADHERVNDCVANLLGKKRIYAQQPTFMHFPRLPAIEFYDRREFSWLADIEAVTESIRSEMLQLLETSPEQFSPYVTHPPGTPLNQWQELNQSSRWSALYLVKEGQQIERNMARCPATMAALASTPYVEIPKRGPTSFFSRLDPNTRIPPHTGVSNTRLIVHLPLIVPENCGFRVGSSIREWRPGTALIFDDTIEHEAWNNSSEPRVILIFDIWNPLLTAAERDVVTAATAAVADYYGDAAPGFSAR